MFKISARKGLSKQNEREIQGKIIGKANEERAKGRKAKVGYQKLILDDNVWKWSKGKGGLECLKTRDTEEQLVMIRQRKDSRDNRENGDTNEVIRIGTCNLQGVFEEGGLKNLAIEAKEHNIDSLAIQETHKIHKKMSDNKLESDIRKNVSGAVKNKEQKG
ncbi:hypothetical protein QE152_g2001 [Popillia japonica]|uniref:Uncharacterized protein n=1 Tax=Popillia japonica TaxID=7064 RepID=A0AAW1N722_POPJA